MSDDTRHAAEVGEAVMGGVELTVWYGEMPESNGRRNWTASLHRKGGGVHFEGFCFARSEYPDRVRYEADRMKWVIGELAERPHILDYDADLHSGYVEPRTPDARAAALEEAAKACDAEAVKRAEQHKAGADLPAYDIDVMQQTRWMAGKVQSEVLAAAIRALIEKEPTT